ncbi:MAG: ATP-dependent sacrificial sulfur transferase LarE [Bacteroidota bacterium]|nr:ATP-dependent sacrificial sulfur transferase LarE [Bacteroidota bacterium]MDP4232826.1 ATP-dependent sacrificial sulfur transferase LarE [Bacteroidota bacterium]MDP4242493.1 ATP-dependent sacrificial sulfur transferase LarE [Bacteroidota bacterium]MDP4289029.1 ATP-dependent sacrificial sulfur transferase LarE [Bacteroidota bacterium]
METLELVIMEDGDQEHVQVDQRSALSRLEEILLSLGSVVIGFSGGVDSTFLLKVARDVLGRERVRAVIGISETYPERELVEAVRLAEEIDAEYETVRTEETDVLKFAENPPDRCYYCKTELYEKLEGIRARIGFGAVIDGTNADDTHEFRPGLRALHEQSVCSPLAEAGLTKFAIRERSRELGLTTADKPSFACLSSRFPYGMAIDRDKLKRIDKAENILRDMGFLAVRVRFHDARTARIELGTKELMRAIEPAHREQIVTALKALDFTYVTLDLQGFRSGSMNEVLTEETKQGYL